MKFINKPETTKEKLFLFLLILICIFSFALSLSFSLEFVISLAEKVIHRTLRDHTKWINILSGVVHIPFLTCLILIFRNFTLLGKKTIELSKNETSNFKTFISKKETKLLFVFVLVFFVFATRQLISADILFQDDISRNHDGDRNWISFGRYISEFLSILIHSTIKLTDVAPLTQYISIFFMAVSIVILVYCIDPESKHPYLTMIPLTFLYLSPYFQDCFLFRFDSPYMVLAVLFPIIPFIYKDNLYSFSYSIFISLILCCMCYQAGSSVYIILVIYFTYNKFVKGEKLSEIGKFVLCSIIAYAASLLIYQLLFSANTTRSDADYYYSTKLTLSALIPNLKYYSSIIFTQTGGLLTKACIFICIALSAFISIKNSKNNKILTLIVFILALILAFALSTGPYIIFETTMLTGRTFMGINCLIAILLYTSFSYLSSEKYLKIAIIPAVLCIYSSIAYLYTLGNCLSEQKNYNEFRYQMIYDDLNDLVDPTQNIYISFEHNVGFCNAFEIALKKYPHLKNTIPCMPSSGSIWNTDYSYRFNFMFDDDESPDSNLPLLKSSYYHDIYGADNHFRIDLHNHLSLD